MKKLTTWVLVAIWLMFANSALMVWFTSDVAVFWKLFYTVFVLCLGGFFMHIPRNMITD